MTGDGTAERPSAARWSVVRNDEDQYSIWPEGSQPPAGWHPAGVSGSEQECLAYVDSVWTDMRPRSLREATDG